VLEVRADDLEPDRKSVDGRPCGQHRGGQPTQPGQRRPRDLIPVRATYAVDGDATGVNVRLVVGWDRGGRCYRAEQHVDVGEEVGAPCGQPGTCLKCDDV